MTAAPPGGAMAGPLRAAHLLAVDPHRLGGAAVRARPGPVRDHWLAALRGALPPSEPVRRLPVGIDDDRLLGGLDLAETLKAGRPIARRGVLAEADGGMVVVPCAERLSPGTAARLAGVLDRGAVVVERDGIQDHARARIGLALLDEGEADEAPPEALLDRLAFRLDLVDLSIRDIAPDTPPDIPAARARLHAVAVTPEIVGAVTEVALRLGIASLRAPLLALAAARAGAALAGRTSVTEDDLAEGVRLVLCPRATLAPAQSDETPPEPPAPDEPTPDDKAGEPVESDLTDRLVEATRAALPPGLLDALQAPKGGGEHGRSRGDSSVQKRPGTTGRPAGSRPGEPRGGARLDLLATLRAAAPWQGLRRRVDAVEPGRVAVRREDFRVGVRKPHSRATAIVAVDASGSSAMNRLAEAKGAVELLLAQAYVRRDRVALLAFRRSGAEILLEPTRSLVRAKRSLAGLPGGGGTPLAAGIEAAARLADTLRRRGDAPTLVLLTDGGANVCRSGETGRAAAAADALAVARRVGAEGLSALVIDTSPRGQPLAGEVAAAMAARYLPLPRADAAAVSRAVRLAMA
ncbi:magnesium chelatase subunit D [Salinarimonas soli]|uniref:Magnesium chelatase subunit D n=1 Tax=Salinarimonas soli TaxID=1638099 RepID=A0A5B2VIB4_9HYPH|nr:magnesium chelatase subunit D [Salinarimonas soli]KAA2238059.1 magnesium chelatase subunit D [Salinarimonas soli]